MAQKINASSIQKHLEIAEIRDDIIILKNKGLRAILMTTSLNFALKSIEEQDAIIQRYQDFLNSLDFTVQIVVSSRKFDISEYTETLQKKQAEQENELLKIQTLEYIGFIKGLTEMVNIMAESFYLVIPYNPFIIKTGFFDKIFEKITKKEKAKTKQEEFQELKNNLWQRVEFITSGLQQLGVKAVPLKNKELIELFYKLYNPSAKEEPEIEKARELRLE